MRCVVILTLLAAVLITWDSPDPAFEVEIERRQETTTAQIFPITGTAYVDREVTPRTHACYRLRYRWPQRTAWTAPVCVDVPRERG